MFNAVRVVDAMIASHQASWVIALAEERAANPKANPEKMDAAISMLMEHRVDAGDIDVDSARVMLSKARTMINAPLNVFLEACEEGYGINGVAKRINAAIGPRGKGGRKAGQGAGKTTKTDAADAGVDEAIAALPNDDRAWRVFIEGMRSKVPARKDWPADRITAFQECCATMIALLKSK